MTSAQSYRAKAATFFAQAKREKIELVRAEYERLAWLYRRWLNKPNATQIIMHPIELYEASASETRNAFAMATTA